MRGGADQPLHAYTWRNGTVLLVIGGSLLVLAIAFTIWAEIEVTNLSWIDHVFLLLLVVGTFVVAYWGAQLRTKAIVQRTAAEEQAQLHIWGLENMDAERATRARHELAHEMAMAIQQEVHSANQRQHLRWSKIVSQVDNIYKAIILVQVELRNNPAGEDILRNLQELHGLVRTFDEDVEPDPEAMTKIFERIMLARMAKEHGVSVNDLSARH